jgi:hypothetical protein
MKLALGLVSVRVSRPFSTLSASYLVQLWPSPVKAKSPLIEFSSLATPSAGRRL